MVLPSDPIHCPRGHPIAKSSFATPRCAYGGCKSPQTSRIQGGRPNGAQSAKLGETTTGYWRISPVIISIAPTRVQIEMSPVSAGLIASAAMEERQTLAILRGTSITKPARINSPLRARERPRISTTNSSDPPPTSAPRLAPEQPKIHKCKADSYTNCGAHGVGLFYLITSGSLLIFSISLWAALSHLMNNLRYCTAFFKEVAV